MRVRHLAWLIPIAGLVAGGGACGGGGDELPDDFTGTDGGGGYGGKGGAGDPVDDLSGSGFEDDEGVGDDSDIGDPNATDDPTAAEEPGLPQNYQDPDDPGGEGDLTDIDDVGDASEPPDPEDLPIATGDDTLLDGAPLDDGALCSADLQFDAVTPPAMNEGTTTALATAPYWDKEYKCPSLPLGGDCTCRGSLYNCQVPNPQPGRSRYLPPVAIRKLNATTGVSKRLEIISKLGRWPVTANTPLYDGRGALVGGIDSKCYDENLAEVNAGHPCVKINFGQTRMLQVAGAQSAERYVLAFSVYVAGKARNGWIRTSAITDTHFNIYRVLPRKPLVWSTTSYVVKGPEDFNCTPGDYDPGKCLPDWTKLSVRPETAGRKGLTAGFYMLRAGNWINLRYSTPLVGAPAADNFGVRTDGLRFIRAKSTDDDHRAIIRVGLYSPGTTTRVKSMYFVFGKIRGRLGWLPLAAIKQGTVKAEEACNQDSCYGKKQGDYCSAFDSQASFICDDQGEERTGLRCSGTQTCSETLVGNVSSVTCQ